MGFGDIAARKNGNDAVKNAIKDGLSSTRQKAVDRVFNTKVGRGASKTRDAYRDAQQRMNAGKCGCGCGKRAGKKGYYKPACHKKMAEEILGSDID